MSDLVVVKVKGVFAFLEAMFNTPTKQIVCNNGFGRRIEFVGNFECKVFDFIRIILFSEGHVLIWFDETHLFLYGMVREDVSVRFYFGIEDLAFLVDVCEEACCRIP